jgi:hypothetical protein
VSTATATQAVACAAKHCISAASTFFDKEKKNLKKSVT